MFAWYHNNLQNNVARRYLNSAEVAGTSNGRIASRPDGGTGSGTEQSTAQSRRGSTLLIALIVTVLVAANGVGPSIGSASQDTTADHPLVGTWVVDPETENPTNPPSFNAFMADGTLVNIGSDGASVGSWEATGPRSATMTFAGLVQGESGVYFIIRGNLAVDESGESFTGAHSFTLISADGTVLMAAEGGGAHGARIPAEPMEASGQPLPGFTIWSPASPEAATPAS